MIEKALAAELGGQVNLTFEPTGVVCTIDSPLRYLDVARDGPILR